MYAQIFSWRSNREREPARTSHITQSAPVIWWSQGTDIIIVCGELFQKTFLQQLLWFYDKGYHFKAHNFACLGGCWMPALGTAPLVCWTECQFSVNFMPTVVENYLATCSPSSGTFLSWCRSATAVIRIRIVFQVCHTLAKSWPTPNMDSVMTHLTNGVVLLWTNMHVRLLLWRL